MLSLHYEYRVIPAPRRGVRGPSGADAPKTTEDRFALAMTQLMNSLGREGWEYQRADTLPVDERAGLTGTKTSYQNMLIFRRVLVAHTPMREPMNEEMPFDDVFDAPIPVKALANSKKPRGKLAAE
jgi:hypothetical protein